MKRSIRGRDSARIQHRRYGLVRAGKASWWSPYRSVDDAIDAAGLE